MKKENVKIGDVVKFSTAGKYNKGFHTTNTYIGEVIRDFGDGDFHIRCREGVACVPAKHIDCVVDGQDDEGSL